MLVAVAVTISAVVAPFARAQGDPDRPPIFDDTPLEQLVALAREGPRDVRRHVARVQELYEEARDRRDIVQMNCIDAQLTQLKGLLELVQLEEPRMDAAIREDDPEKTRYSAAKIVVAARRAAELRADAERCVGAVSTYTGQTDVTVEPSHEIILDIEFDRGSLYRWRDGAYAGRGPTISCQPVNVQVGDPVQCRSGEWDCRSPIHLIDQAIDIILELLRLFARAFHGLEIPEVSPAMIQGEPPVCGESQAPAPPVLWTMESEVEVVGVTYPGGDNFASVDFTIPAGTPAGTHTVSAISWVDDDDPVLVSTNINVGDEAGPTSTLPATGSDTTIPLWKLGVLLVVMGGLLARARARAERRWAAAEQARAERWVADPDHAPTGRSTRSRRF